MRVLCACEYSQIVTQAFRDKGHEAFSCDIIPTEGNPDWHYQEDVLKVLGREKWDMMIAFPPCTYLTYAGTAHWNKLGREKKREQALDFFLRLYNSKVDKVCIENPVGYANKVFRKPDQIIHPYYFGEPYMKRTCLWLKNLPKLVPTNMLPKPDPVYVGKNGRKYYTTDAITGKNGGGHKRSRFWTGIAEAMAEQWGEL